MKLITVIFSFLLLGYACCLADNYHNVNRQLVMGEDEPSDVFGILGEIQDSMEIRGEEAVLGGNGHGLLADEEEVGSTVNDWDRWLLYFARDAWGQEQTFEPEGGDALGTVIRWVWGQLPHMGGMGLAAGQEAFAHGYNILLNQEGPQGLGARRAQVCLEQIYWQFVHGVGYAPPIAAWLVLALDVVQNRRPFLAGNCG